MIDENEVMLVFYSLLDSAAELWPRKTLEERVERLQELLGLTAEEWEEIVKS